MLCALYISHIALIDHLELPIEKRFVVLTGETGAGKSILIDSVGLLLGERADRDLIQAGQEKALVEGVFEVPDSLRGELEDLGIEPEEGRVILSRELSVAGKNLCRINGRLAGLSLLKSVGALLVDIHGQHGNQALLSPERHLEFLDGYATVRLTPLLQKTADLYARYRTACELLQKGFGTEAERERRADALRFQIEEITSAAPKDGEDDALGAERTMLANAQNIRDAVELSCACLNGSDEGQGAVSLVQQAAEELRSLSSLGSPYDELQKRLEEAGFALEDAAMELRSLCDRAADDPYRLEEVEARLDALFRLKKNTAVL